ncbi:hypothetical protein ACJX0J_038219, partial [Zea mays]
TFRKKNSATLTNINDVWKNNAKHSPHLEAYGMAWKGTAFGQKRIWLHWDAISLILQNEFMLPFFYYIISCWGRSSTEGPQNINLSAIPKGGGGGDCDPYTCNYYIISKCMCKIDTFK